jgi:hypothetical protein
VAGAFQSNGQVVHGGAADCDEVDALGFQGVICGHER